MQESENIALVDLDGTLADYHGRMMEDMATLANPTEVYNFPAHWGDIPQWMEARRQMISRQPGWWANLPPLQLGFDIMNILKDFGCEIHILTKGPGSKPIAWKEKVEWVQKYVDESANITITNDKGLVYGKILVDDWPDYILRWLEWRPRGLVIMPAHPYNENFAHSNVIRYDGTNRQKLRDIISIRLVQDLGSH